MNNHRYTYMNGRPTRTNQHYSAERSAFNPTHNSHSKPSVSKQAQGEKINEMATKIIQEVNRLHNTTQLRAITKEMLKEGGSKIFFDVFAILARALDEKIERQELNLQVILSILKLFNYPGNLMKNMFQPIGAPHTWHHCLAILDFMAEIAHYTLAFKAHCHQVSQNSKDLQKDDNYLMIRAVFEENPKILSSKFEEELHQLQFKIQNLNKEIKQSQHVIRSLHLHQRPLQELTNEINAEQKRLQAYQNDLLSKKIERQFYISEIDKVKRGLQKFQNKQIELNNQMASLEYRLAHKELTAEELAKLHEEVKEKKSEDKELEQKLMESTNRIKRAYETAITELRLNYAKVNFAANQICSHPSNSNSVEISFVDNFQQLSILCDSLLTPQQPQECNISQELNTIAAAWDLQGLSSKANAVLSQSRSRLCQKEREYYELSLKCEQTRNQEYRLLTFSDELKRRKNNQLQMVSFQQSELQRLKSRLSRLRQANSQISSEVLRLKQKRMRTEDEVTLLMDQIQAIRRESLQFKQAMQVRLKVADQSIQAAKMTMLTLLEKHRSDLGELLLKSKANEYINQILGKLKSKNEQSK